MNRRPPRLPNIEDATLRACLAPLMEAMQPAAEPAREAHTYTAAERSSNDNPLPAGEPAPISPVAHPAATASLAEWRSAADDEFGVFRTIELFLEMTDSDLAAAAAAFPRQIEGTLARIDRMKQRLAVRYDRAAAVLVLLERAKATATGRADPLRLLDGAAE